MVDNVAYSCIGSVFFVELGTKLVFDLDIFIEVIPYTALVTIALLVSQVVSAGVAARYRWHEGGRQHHGRHRHAGESRTCLCGSGHRLCAESDTQRSGLLHSDVNRFLAERVRSDPDPAVEALLSAGEPIKRRICVSRRANPTEAVITCTCRVCSLPGG